MSEYIITLEGELGMALAVACVGAGFARKKIVRCRNCEYYDPNEQSTVLPYHYWCNKLTVYMPTDGFCSIGKLKMEEE